VVETKSAFYKVLSWSALENKDKFKTDFQKIYTVCGIELLRAFINATELAQIIKENNDATEG